MKIFYLVIKYLIKHPVVYFLSSVSTLKNSSDIYVIRYIITKIIGTLFYCGTNFLNTLYYKDKHSLWQLYYFTTVLPAKSDSEIMVCLQSCHGLIIDRSFDLDK